jgi:hypothetical protein
MPKTFIAGRVFNTRGNHTKDDGTAGGDAVAYTVGAETILRAIDDAYSALSENTDPISGKEYLQHGADEIYSIVRNPAKAGIPDVILDNLAAVLTKITVINDFGAGTAVYPASDPATGREVVFYAGEKVTFSLVSDKIGTSAQYKCWALKNVAGQVVGEFRDALDDTDPASATPTLGAFCHVEVAQDAVGLQDMTLTLCAGASWDPSVLSPGSGSQVVVATSIGFTAPVNDGQQHTIANTVTSVTCTINYTPTTVTDPRILWLSEDNKIAYFSNFLTTGSNGTATNTLTVVAGNGGTTIKLHAISISNTSMSAYFDLVIST